MTLHIVPSGSMIDDDTSHPIEGEWETFATSFRGVDDSNNTSATSTISALLKNQVRALSPIKKTAGDCITTPPKLVRKDANGIIVDVVVLKETPVKNLFRALAYETPPHKKLFGDEEEETDTPKTCNTSNLSSSFAVNQISFDPNKPNDYGDNTEYDAEVSFDTLFSNEDNTAEQARRRSYFDDSMEQEEETLPTSRNFSMQQVERVFLKQVDTIMEKFMWACATTTQEQQPEKTKSTNRDNAQEKENTTTTATATDRCRVVHV